MKMKITEPRIPRLTIMLVYSAVLCLACMAIRSRPHGLRTVIEKTTGVTGLMVNGLLGAIVLALIAFGYLLACNLESQWLKRIISAGKAGTTMVLIAAILALSMPSRSYADEGYGPTVNLKGCTWVVNAVNNTVTVTDPAGKVTVYGPTYSRTDENGVTYQKYPVVWYDKDGTPNMTLLEVGMGLCILGLMVAAFCSVLTLPTDEYIPKPPATTPPAPTNQPPWRLSTNNMPLTGPLPPADFYYTNPPWCTCIIGVETNPPAPPPKTKRSWVSWSGTSGDAKQPAITVDSVTWTHVTPVASGTMVDWYSGNADAVSAVQNYLSGGSMAEVNKYYKGTFTELQSATNTTGTWQGFSVEIWRSALGATVRFSDGQGDDWVKLYAPWTGRGYVGTYQTGYPGLGFWVDQEGARFFKVETAQ